MISAASRPGWIAIAAAALAMIGSLFIHPVALLGLAAPYVAFVIYQKQVPTLRHATGIVGVSVVLGVILWVFSDVAFVSLCLVALGLSISIVAFFQPSSMALAFLSGASLALAIASAWMTYPPTLLIGLCFGAGMLCLHIQGLETLRNVQLDLEVQIEMRTQRIRYLLRERDEVTTLAIHDLQSPIQAVEGMQKTLLHMLNDQVPDKESMRQALEVAIETNADLSNRIGSLLKSGRDHLGGTSDSTSLSRIIDGTIATHKIGLRGREISIDMGDATQVHLRNQEDIKDILDVLLDNAICYAPKASTIQITAQYNATLRTVVIDIQDDGPGVPRKKRDTLFSAPVDRQTKDERTGLGLYLASRRATRLGGALKHVSPSGGGTIFRLSLPATRDDALPNS